MMIEKATHAPVEIPAAMPPDNLIRTAELAYGVQVIIPEWVSFRAGDFAIFYIAGKVNPVVQSEIIYDKSAFPVSVILPADEFLATGYVSFYYSVVSDISGTETGSSEPQTIRVDRFPPNTGIEPDPLRFSDEIMLNGITQDYLATHNNEVEVVVPGTNDWEAGDTVTLRVDERYLSGPHMIPAAGDSRLIITRGEIEAMGNSRKKFTYVLYDRAGNTNNGAPATFIEIVDVKPVLPPPAIYLAGARSQRGPYYYSCPNRLTVRGDEEGVQLRWRYVDETVFTDEREFLDIRPEVAVEVSYQREGAEWEVFATLRPVNITGLYSNMGWRSGCLIKDNGTLEGWGERAEILPPASLTDVNYVTTNSAACTAVHLTGTLSCWGDPNAGGTAPAQVSGVRHVVASGRAFAALLESGNTVVWGDPDYGGNIPAGIRNELYDLEQIVGSHNAFAALRRDGEVFCWGSDWPDGIHIDEPKGFLRLQATNYAFAGITRIHTVVAWGDKEKGGVIPSAVLPLLSHVSVLASTSSAFAALTRDRRVLAWGIPGQGGEMPFTVTDAVSLVGSTTAFALITLDGDVRAWGDPVNGGTVPPGLKAATLIAGYGSFAAIRPDGTAISWGITSGEYTGNDTAAVYPAAGNFVVLTTNNALKVWGRDELDLSYLDGQISYQYGNDELRFL